MLHLKYQNQLVSIINRLVYKLFFNIYNQNIKYFLFIHRKGNTNVPGSIELSILIL